jgi:phytanoyl-CoA hydroxylase
MLTAQQKQSYDDNGYVLLKSVFTARETDLMRDEIEAIGNRLHRSPDQETGGWSGEWRVQLKETQGKQTALLSIHDLQFHSALFTRLLLDDRVTESVADLIGPNVQLHHSKMHWKPAEKGTPFPMHQDYHYFPHAGQTMIAYIIHVDDATIENGCLCIYPGSHKRGLLPHAPDGLYLSPDQYPLEKATPCPAKAGDVLMFSYLTIHGSYVNRTATTRRILLFQFRSPTDMPIQETHLSPGQGLMLRGINPEPDRIPRRIEKTT